MGYGWLNVASLLLGLVSWLLPVLILLQSTQKSRRNQGWFSFVSLSACSVSLWMQIVYQNHLVEKGDLAAVMDTIGTLVKVSAVLVAVTLLLNAGAGIKAGRFGRSD